MYLTNLVYENVCHEAEDDSRLGGKGIQVHQDDIFQRFTLYSFLELVNELKAWNIVLLSEAKVTYFYSISSDKI